MERERIIETLKARIAELNKIAGMSKNGLPAMARVAQCQRMIAILEDGPNAPWIDGMGEATPIAPQRANGPEARDSYVRPADNAASEAY